MKTAGGPMWVSVAKDQLDQTAAAANATQVLEPRNTVFAMRQHVFVIGGVTPQTVLEAHIMGFASDGTFLVDPGTTIDWNMYHGCPVLDEAGRVVGVLASFARPDGPVPYNYGRAIAIAPMPHQ